jgi:hypothetical protein
MPSGIYKRKPLSAETKLKISLSQKKKPRKPHSAETKALMSKQKMGHPVSEETKRKISFSQKGKPRSVESIKKMAASLRGRKLTKEHKEKVRKSLIGHLVSEETRKKISLANKGKKSFLGRKQSEETKRKIGEANRGSKSAMWLGGISFFPYTLDWTGTLRRSIRERDNYCCQICGILQDNRAFAVHHIDYNKTNCDPKNLITLCHRCHSSTNSNRKKWQEYLKNIINNKYLNNK